MHLTHLHLGPRSRICGATSLHLHTCLRVVDGVHFTFLPLLYINTSNIDVGIKHSYILCLDCVLGSGIV
jgi:hypothetical protein